MTGMPGTLAVLEYQRGSFHSLDWLSIHEAWKFKRSQAFGCLL